MTTVQNRAALTPVALPMGTLRRLKAFIVNYVDGLVIRCKRAADVVMQTMPEVIKKLQMAANENKTRICRLPEERFEGLSHREVGTAAQPDEGRAGATGRWLLLRESVQ
jgi:hypothetical protein